MSVSMRRPTDKVLKYSEVRSSISSGDILLFQGTKPLSRLIRWGTQSVYSHAGLATWWNGRLMVVQAVGKGAQVIPVSSAVVAYNRQVDWFTLRDEYRGAIDHAKLIDFAIELLGRDYSYLGLLALMGRMLLGTVKSVTDLKKAPGAIFCSQYVSYCYRMAGTDLVRGIADHCTSPADLAASKYLLAQGTLEIDVDEFMRNKPENLPGRVRQQHLK